MGRDQDVRDRIERDLDRTFLVEAAAGTGKTTALVRRILALVRTGRTTLVRIVAMTFTEKAAGEMKLRLRAGIEEARKTATAEEAARLERALRELEAARIGTIHGFCGDLLRERPVEAGVDPLFEVAPDAVARVLFDEAFETWFQEQLGDPSEGVRRVLRRSFHDDRDRPRHTLWQAGRGLADIRDFRGQWRRDPFDRDDAIDDVIAQLSEVGALAKVAQDPDSWLAKNVEEIRRWCTDLSHRESVRERDYDGLEAELRAVKRGMHWHWRGYDQTFAPGLTRDEVAARRDAAKESLDRLVERCDADLAPCLQSCLWSLVDAYERRKERAGRLDFLDLLQKARDLLVRDRAVREDLQKRFTHVLVDEFQDTDPLQAEIVLLLAADDPATDDAEHVRVAPGRLFLVGDPKQSIYRFRRADLQLYVRLKRRLLQEGAEVLHLTTSFRGDPRLQRVVNAAFSEVMRGDGQAEYVPLEPFRPEQVEHPAVVVLPVPQPFSQYGKITKSSCEESFPAAVGAFVEWLVKKSGWRVSEPGALDSVPVTARHVCLLFRRFQSWGVPTTDPFTSDLEARGIPHVLVGGRTFNDREEVLALRNALAAIEWPDDELSVFATLRGPLFAVGDDALVAWHGQVGRLHPLGPLGDDELPEELAEVREPLRILRRLHYARNRRPIADTVTALLDATRAHAGLLLWNAGEQVLANVLRVVELARRFEARGAISFRSFVDFIDAEQEHGESPEALVVEDGTEGVRIMTVHRAKGLEFPVVIVCDYTANATSEMPSRHIEAEGRRWYEPLAGCVPVELLEHRNEVLRRDREESERVLYVAATRARDVLVLPGLAARGSGSDWLERAWTWPIERTLRPGPGLRRDEAPAPGCPHFGGEHYDERNVSRVRPGRYRDVETGRDIVWWDPGVLDLAPRRLPGFQRHWVLTAERTQAAEDSVRTHEHWRAARAERVASARAESWRVRTPTEGERPQGAGSVRWDQTTAADEERSSGRRFGSLVHAVLADVPLDADSDTLDLWVTYHARLTGVTKEVCRAAARAVRAALAHDLLQRAARAEDCRREEPVACPVADGSVLEGVVDLAFCEAGRWVVVDFKTNRSSDQQAATYEAQVAWYVQALEEATGGPVEGVLLRV